jgi:NhaP-type Na+/H+ or K+/H+ antiporter
MGWLVIVWISRILKDNQLIVAVTVFATHLLFYWSETTFEVSGILALVAFGVYLGTFGRVHLSHENDHAVHTVWSFMGFILETLIFLITGTFVGEQLQNIDKLALVPSDYWKALLFYPFLMVVRYLLMMLQRPILNKLGYEITKTSALILSYGGLRGAIALSLGLLVALDDFFNTRFRDVCLFYIFVIIVMTVLVNGLTMKILMKKTGFLKEDPVKVKLKSNLMR